MSKRLTRGERNIAWCEKFCTFVDGPFRGRPLYLTEAERAIVIALYDRNGEGVELPIRRPLAGYLSLLHLAGCEAILKGSVQPPLEPTDIWTLWACAKNLQHVLIRRGSTLVCPALGRSLAA